MKELDLQYICSQVCLIAERAATYIANEREQFSISKVENKSSHSDLVSYVDRTAESIIVEQLRRLTPDALFITEEETTTNQHGMITDQSLTWIIDPLDGTTNFVHGMPPYAVSIALMSGQKEIVVGVVYEITKRECFSAYKKGGAYLNNKSISVSQIDSLDQSLIITGLAHFKESRTVSDFVRLFDYFNSNTHGARRLGSAATDLVYVAAGRAEGFYQANLAPWDVAAGALIVEEAAGRVSDFTGGGNYIFGREIIASNTAIYNTFKHTLESV